MTFKMSVCGNQDREKVERTRSPEGDVCSMASRRSKEFQINFTDGDFPTDLSKQTETPRIRRQKQLDLILADVEQKADTLLKIEIKRFQKLLSPDYPACPEGEGEGEKEEEVYQHVREGALMITLHVLEDLKHTELATTLRNQVQLLSHSQYQDKLRSTLLEKCRRVHEGIWQQGSSALLNEALKVNSASFLRELNISRNHFQESGVKLLTDILQDPHCTLKNLQMET